MSVCLVNVRVFYLFIFAKEPPIAVEVAHGLRELGDALYWRYKLLELLIRNYKAAHRIK